MRKKSIIFVYNFWKEERNIKPVSEERLVFLWTFHRVRRRMITHFLLLVDFLTTGAALAAFWAGATFACLDLSVFFC